MFLSAEDVVGLTGLTRPSAQARWLAQHGFRHTINGAGAVVLLRSEVERHLLGGLAPRREPRVKLETLR